MRAQMIFSQVLNMTLNYLSPQRKNSRVFKYDLYEFDGHNYNTIALHRLRSVERAKLWTTDSEDWTYVWANNNPMNLISPSKELLSCHKVCHTAKGLRTNEWPK